VIKGRRSLRWWLFNGIAPTGLLVLSVWYVYPRRSQFQSLTELPLTELLLAGVLAVIASYINSLEFALLYRAMGARVGEHWMLYAAGQVLNYVPGQLGTWYRLRYLKKVHRLSYPYTIIAYSFNFVITLFATGVVGLAGCIALGIKEDTWSILLMSSLIALLAIASLSAVLPIKETTRLSRIGSAWMRVSKGWQRARANRSVAIGVLLLELVRYALLAWRLDVAFGWLGVDESIFFFLIVAPIAALTTFIAITPAGLGIREVAIGTVVLALGRSFDSGLFGSSVDRAVHILIILILGVPGVIYTTRVMSRTSASGTARDSSDKLN